MCGGNTCFNGMAERLKKEVGSIAEREVRVHAVENRQNGVWIGGAILTSLSSFSKLWISKKDFQEHGANIVHQKV